MLFYDIINVLNKHIGEKLPVKRICFLIRNEGDIQDGSTGVRINDDNVNRRLRKMYMRGIICRDKGLNNSYLYYVEKEIVFNWSNIGKT